jgi:small-conductance mechanosensitive channel
MGIIQKIDEWDRNLSNKIHQSVLGPLEALIMIFGMAFTPSFIWNGLLIVYVAAIMNFRHNADITTGIKLFQIAISYAAFFVMWILITTFLTLQMKRFFGRERPVLTNTIRFTNLRSKEGHKALPSGDTA